MDDATLPWTYPADHFDYVHMRYLFGSIADWDALLRQAYRCCRPGGYVESFEASCVFRSDDGTLLEGSPMDQWGKVFVEAGRKFGRPFDVVGDGLVQEAFRKAGFEEIVEWEYKVRQNSCQRSQVLGSLMLICFGSAQSAAGPGTRRPRRSASTPSWASTWTSRVSLPASFYQATVVDMDPRRNS